MPARLLHALTGRAAGPIASSVAALLAVALAASWAQAAHSRTELEARIAALQAQISRPDVAWTSASPATPQGVQPVALVGALAPTPPAPARPGAEGAAERLVKEAPTGFDACARMESADAAVLGALEAHK